jgi:hypothetical protein
MERWVACRPSLAVNWNVLPWSNVLSTSNSPSIISTNLLLIERPSAVPPYLRVVEASAWLKVLKKRAR